MSTQQVRRVGELSGQAQHYAWGSPVAIPTLLGDAGSGEPLAELWFGAHPKAPSQLQGRALDAILAEEPGVLGAARSYGRLPFLLKLLAADHPLSLQAHPSRAQAEAGFAAEEETGPGRDAPDRNYRDDWPKPEMLVALEPTQALCGFREPAETAALLRRLGMDELEPYAVLLSDPDPTQALSTAFLGLLGLGGAAADLVAAAAERCARVEATRDDPLWSLARTVVELAEHYPGDPGVLAATLLNRLDLAPGQGVFLPAGNMHAYLSGFGVEIMANSDNVLRGGLTSKHVDLVELGRVLDFRPLPAEVITPVEDAPGRERYATPSPEFALWRVAGASAELPDVGSPKVVLAIDPLVVDVAGEEHDLHLAPGHAGFVAAGEPGVVRASGLGFIAAPGAAAPVA